MSGVRGKKSTGVIVFARIVFPGKTLWTVHPSHPHSVAMLSSVRRHSLRLQTELHRWSICDPGSHLLADSFLTRVPACISRSKSCTSSAGESDGSRGSWSSSDSVISSDSSGDLPEPGSPYRVVLLGASGVGKTAFASIFAGAADSMDSDYSELCGGEEVMMTTLKLISMLLFRWTVTEANPEKKQKHYLIIAWLKGFELLWWTQDVLGSGAKRTERGTTCMQRGTNTQEVMINYIYSEEEGTHHVLYPIWLCSFPTWRHQGGSCTPPSAGVKLY